MECVGALKQVAEIGDRNALGRLLILGAQRPHETAAAEAKARDHAYPVGQFDVPSEAATQDAVQVIA